MDVILEIIDRAARAEETAAAIYETLAERFRANRPFFDLWSDLAADERSHGRKLREWRRLLEQEPASGWPIPSGFGTSLAELERTLEDLRERAGSAVAPDEAFAIALEMETSELDSIYTELLQGSPLSRYPDLGLTRGRELSSHHAKIVAAVRAHAQDEDLQLRADLLELDRWGAPVSD